MTGLGRGGALVVGAFVLAVVVQLLGFFLSLGWFVPLLQLAGGLGVVLLVRRVDARPRPFRLLLVLSLLAYAVGLAATEAAWFGRESRVTAAMTWDDLGPDNDFGESEVVLRFAEHPGALVGEYSNRLARHLRAAARDTVVATFAVTRDLGCLRGFRLVEVDGLSRWRSAWGYAGSRGSGGGRPPGPWGRDPWWCP